MKSLLKRVNSMWDGVTESWYNPNRDLLFKFRHCYKKQIRIKTTKTEFRFDISSDSGRRFFVLKSYFRMGRIYEEPVVNILENVNKPNTCFLDIGANVGYFTVIAAKFFNQGFVHAFEMDPELVVEIERNAALNEISNINIVTAAIWDSDGKIVSFEPHEKGDKAKNIVQHSETSSKLSTPTLKIDSYCRNRNVSPDITKIDVEGSEVRVLNGMQEALDNIKILFLEVHPFHIHKFGNSLEEIQRILNGYRFTLNQIQGLRAGYQQARLLPVEDLTSITHNTMLICEKG